ncbi:MAG: NAD(P)-binding protein [Elusimicrobia bacterium]|nr:NAD(P)-binding protein [Elusimicrobiota bacterium]
MILGAGPSGLAAACEFNKTAAAFLIIEKAPEVGGLSRTLTYGDFKTDIGPHRFFSKNKYLYELIAALLGKHWIKVARRTRFHVKGRYLLYPVELKNALLGIGIMSGLRMLADYSYQRLKSLFIRTAPRSFEEKVVSDFGRALAELNILNYTEKIWGMPCSEISPDWATQRIKDLSLTGIFKKMVFEDKQHPKTLADQFYYPDSGSGLIYESMQARLGKNTAGKLTLNTCPLEIKHDGKDILGVVLKDPDGKRLEVSPRDVISSIPITELISLFNPAPGGKVLEACRRLRFRSHVSLLVTINKRSVFQDQWIYFPDKETPFCRVMEPRNFHPGLAPAGKTSLLIEFFCWHGDDIWSASKERLLGLSLVHLKTAGLLAEEDISGSFVHREKYAYPVYDLGYKENLHVVKDYFRKFKHLQLIGRAGSFKYNNQDHAIEMGILAARNVLENKYFSLDEVGSEQEYFEPCRK